MKQHMGTIGPSVLIRGELSATDDLTIEGQVDGKIELDRNVLTIGTGGRIAAQILARVVIVMGKVKGTITATEAISIRETASVEGELAAPKISISEGAFFRGQVDMQRPEGEALPAKDTGKENRARQQPAKPPATRAYTPVTASVSASG